MILDLDRYLPGAEVNLFQPHVILPAQLLTPTELTPERRLMVAVLNDAVYCLEKYRFPTDARGRRLFRNAKQWLLASDPRWPYSFECICAVLNLDVNAVRRRLQLSPESPAVPLVRGIHSAMRKSGRPGSATSDLAVALTADIRRPRLRARA